MFGQARLAGAGEMMDSNHTIARMKRIRARLAAKRGNWLRRGLTLIELAIVLVVLALIFVLVYSNLDTSVIDDAKVALLKGQSKTLPLKLMRWQERNAPLPDGASLTAITQDPEEVNDPWGNPYFVCAGADGRANQICSWGEEGENSNTRFYLTDRSTWPPEFRGEQVQEQ